jgi:hypothetical protein
MTLAIASCLTRGHHAPRHAAIRGKSGLPRLPRSWGRPCTPQPAPSPKIADLKQGSRQRRRTSRIATVTPMQKAVSMMNASGSEIA